MALELTIRVKILTEVVSPTTVEIVFLGAMVDAAKATADGMGETVIIDHTEINTVQLRRTIYLTIQSSVDFEECVHKLLKLQIPEKMWKGKFSDCLH